MKRVWTPRNDIAPRDLVVYVAWFASGAVATFCYVHVRLGEVDVRHLVSLNDTAQQLKLQIATLRGWRLKRTHLEFVKVGGRVCATQESIDEFVTANSCPALPIASGRDLKHFGRRGKVADL